MHHAVLKRNYLRMAKREQLGSPELKAFEAEKRNERKRAKLKERRATELAELQQKARTYADELLDEMYGIATSDTAMDSAKISATQMIWDRAYGKAAQTNVNANVTNGKPSEITGSALAKRIEAALRRVEEITGGGSPTPASKERPADVCKRDIDPDSSTRH